MTNLQQPAVHQDAGISSSFVAQSAASSSMPVAAVKQQDEVEQKMSIKYAI